jgi:hypothetical protein
MRRLLIVGTAALFAFAGPRLVGPQDRKATESFVFAPPEGFVEVKAGPDGAALGADETLWEHPPLPGHTTSPRVHLKRSKMGGTVEAADLAKLKAGMPELLQPMGLTWKDVRQETRVRSDGARVGLIEGESVGTSAIQLLGGGDGKEYQRRLLFLFPTNDGTALTTCVYAKEERATWEPQLEASIMLSRGVAVRLPPPEQWLYFAWGGAGLVLALLGSALWKRGERPPEKS